MIRPKPCSFIAAKAARMVWKAAERLSARIASHFSTGKSSIGLTCWMPALLTRMSTRPSSPSASPIRPLAGVGGKQIGVAVDGLDAELLLDRGAGLFDLVPVAEAVDDDVGARRGEGAGDAEADAAGGAGDDRHPPGERGRGVQLFQNLHIHDVILVCARTGSRIGGPS